MPVYTIENEKGERQDIVRSVERRDCVPPGWKRVFVPTRGFVAGVVEPESCEGSIPKALRQAEDKQNYRQIEKDTGFSVGQLRKIWDF